MLAGPVEDEEVGFPLEAELGLLAAQPTLGAGDLHPLAGAYAGWVGFELGDHGQDVEQQPGDRVGRVVYRPAEAEPKLAGGELVGDGARVRKGAGEAVELGDDEGVADAAGGEGLAKPRAVAVGAGQAVVDVEAVSGTPSVGRPSRWAVRS